MMAAELKAGRQVSSNKKSANPKRPRPDKTDKGRTVSILESKNQTVKSTNFSSNQKARRPEKRRTTNIINAITNKKCMNSPAVPVTSPSSHKTNKRIITLSSITLSSPSLFPKPMRASVVLNQTLCHSAGTRFWRF